MTTVEKIFQLMNEKKITAKEFATKTGLSQGNITDWKTGRARPSTDALLKISDAYNVTIEWLLGKTYFRNELEHVLLIQKAVNIVRLLKKDTVKLLDECINILVSKNSDEKVDNEIIEISKKFPKKYKEFSELIFKTLYYDYKESKDMYKIVYGIDEFSVDAFLQYSKLRYPDHYFTDKVKGARNSLKKMIQSRSNVFPTPTDSKLYMCPVYGRIAAGVPNWAEQCMEGRLPLDPDMMNIHSPEECFFLRVSGESMNKIVKNGGYALIRKQEDVDNGDIAVVLVNGYDATLKKFTRKNDMVVLEPMSDDSSFEIQIYDHTTQIKILGKYIGKFEMN